MPPVAGLQSKTGLSLLLLYLHFLSITPFYPLSRSFAPFSIPPFFLLYILQLSPFLCKLFLPSLSCSFLTTFYLSMTPFYSHSFASCPFLLFLLLPPHPLSAPFFTPQALSLLFLSSFLSLSPFFLLS